MSEFSTPSACIVADKANVAKVVLMPGDPLRAKYIAETYLEDPVCFNTVRNMLGYTGTYKGKKISVMGSGMGIPSAVLYLHELFNFFDVEAVIRVGSAGALRDEINVKDIVIAMGATTNSGFADTFGFPGKLAPTADFDMLYNAFNICKDRGTSVKVGNVFTTDLFYNPNPDVPELARKFGCLAVEMETAGFYLEAMNSGKKALSIVSISDHMFRPEALSALERQESFNEMMEISLETAWKQA